MKITTSTLSYGPGGAYTGFAAHPERHDAAIPAIVVCQEIFGVDEHIKDVTRRYAEAGYFAFAPDLYSDHGKRPPAFADSRIEAVKLFMDRVPPGETRDPEKRAAYLAKLPAQEASELGESLGALFGGADPTKYREKLAATSAFLREENALTKGQPIGSVGFCFGGGLSGVLAAVDPKLAGAIIYYGRSPDEEEVRRIACPVIGFYGEMDPGITGTVPELAERMKRAGRSFEHHVFRGAYHAFFNDQRKMYNAEAARWSFARALSFFAERLSPDPRLR